MKAGNSKKERVRNKIKRVNRSDRKRILLNLTNRHMNAQLIDDVTGKTVLTVSTMSIENKGNKNLANKDNSKKLAELFADKVKEKNVAAENGFVFDRGGHLYHGKVAIFADVLREKGLKF